MKDDQLTYQFGGVQMPASEAIQKVIEEAQKIREKDPASADAFIAYYSDLFNHTITIATIEKKAV